jgi:hypothetical protein
MLNERDPKINDAQCPVIYNLLQKVREVGKEQFFIYETRRVCKAVNVKQSELQSQVLTVVGLNYCKDPRVSGIQYYSAIGQFPHVFSPYTLL